jgi:CheY-like chemotaxis protein
MQDVYIVPISAPNKELAMARVLIVDDDEGARDTVRTVLEEEGYEVAEAEYGHCALDHLRASAEPLVVLLDYRMPQLNGGEVLRAAAKKGCMRAMPLP